MAEYKQWRNEDRTYLKDVVPLDTPYNIKIEVSSLCNAECNYCAHSKPDAGGVWQGNMSMELFEKIIDDIKKLNHRPKLIEMYMFGEPLCNPNLAKMIARVKEENIVDTIAFTTNGLLFTPERIDSIIAAGVDIIRISLQGINSETYKKICGVTVDFESFLKNLNYLYAHKGNCQIRMKIADIALKDIPDGKNKFMELFADKADSVFVETILPLYKQVDYKSIDENIGRNVLCGREGVKTDNVHMVCHRPFFRVRIAANGIVSSACCDTPNDIIYGDITKESLSDIWNGKRHMEFLKMQLKGNRFKHPSCKECVAANDITTEADYLDPWANQILAKMQ